ncbi:Bre2p [Sugiyamaella lignohabitans]|uniref:Bre2p n=1 Tax=Sugiyamaella lignohabitans TaxID=796027 RepID=A0A167DB70_9ASCO|nr:Bre2p [Sugiyamaella lignohabitans]ANB12704.1 Bre2p [Sugiyamaella lignohabitans]
MDLDQQQQTQPVLAAEKKVVTASVETPAAGSGANNNNNKRQKRKKDHDWSSSHESTPVPGESAPVVVPRIRPPPLQPNDLRAVPHRPAQQPAEVLNGDNGSLPAMFMTEDHPHNKRGFRYIQCSGNPSLSSVLYAIAEVPPYAARVSYEDRSSQVFISDDALTVTSNQGFRSARANVGIREGQWYFEVKIVRANDPSDKSAPDAHVRLGITRREASLEAPAGHDAYGYGLRDVGGEKVHCSRPQSFMNESFKSGDVIGLYINIPRTDAPGKLIPPDISRDRIPIRYKGQLYFETLDYIPTKSMDELILPKTLYNKKRKDSEKFVPATIPGSYIQVFKNGKDMGIAFEDLIEFLPPHCQFQKNMAARDADDGQAGYYPTISVFRGGMARFNFGPNFEYPIENTGLVYKPLSMRYDEQIADDIVYDLIDQVDFEITDALEDAKLAREAASQAKLPHLPSTTTATTTLTNPTTSATTSTSTLRNVAAPSTSPSPAPAAANPTPNIVEIAP